MCAHECEELVGRQWWQLVGVTKHEGQIKASYIMNLGLEYPECKLDDGCN